MDSAEYQKCLKSKNYEQAIHLINSSLKNNPEQNLCNQPDPENEMTLLMHTIFTGNLPCVNCLLATAANKKEAVNYTIHKNDYTPLMMSTLSGNLELVKMLLQAGANKSARSSIGKTAAELAAFTGQSEIAALLSNYYSNEKVTCAEVKRLLAETNLAPSNVALNYDLAKIDVDQLMDLYHEEEWPLSAKCAYFYHLIGDIKQAPSVRKYIKLQSISSNLEGTKPFQHAAIVACIEKIAKKNPDFNQSLQDLHARANSLNQKNSTEFALRLIEDIFCHIKVRKQAERCDVCFRPACPKQCVACKSIRYCNEDCAKLGWFDHKKWCCKLQEWEKQAAADKASGKKPEIDMSQLQAALK